MLLTTENYKAHIESLLTNSKTLNIAVAYWGVGPEGLLANVDKKTTRIICNLNMGGTNPHAIERIRDAGYNIKHLDDFHAKVVCGQSEYILGSANISANGLGLEGDQVAKLLELGIQGSEKSVLREVNTWFEGIWDDSKKITDLDLKRLKKIWAKRRTDMLDLSGKNYRLDSSLFDGVNAYVCFTTVEDDPEAEKQGEKALEVVRTRIEKETGEIADDSIFDTWSHFIDWRDLPIESYLIDVYVNEDITEVFEITSIYKREPGLDQSSKHKSIQMVQEVPDFFCIKNGNSRGWRKLLKDLEICAIKYVETLSKDENRDPEYIIPLSELLKEIGQ